MSSRTRVIIASGCITYLSLGIAGATLGPLLPELAGRTGIALGGAGLVLSFYYLGGVLSRLVAGVLSDRYGPVRVLLGGLIVEAGSSILLTLSRSPVVLFASTFLLGVALGAGLLGAVLIATKLVPSRGVALANLVNAFWGVGSFVGPALFSAISASTTSGLPTVWVSGGVALLAIPLLLAARPPDRQDGGGTDLDTGGGLVSAGAASLSTEVLRAPSFWLFGLVLLFDVGTESTIGGWTAVYLQRTTAVNLQIAALVVSGFFVSFAAGRLGTAALGSRVAAPRVLGGGIVLALSGMGLVSALPGHLIPTVAGFILAGLGIGPIYPTVVALVTRRFGRRSGTAVGLAGSLGFAGGVIFPWTAGILMSRRGGAAPMCLVEALLVVVAIVSYLSVTTMRSGGAAREPSSEPDA